MLPFIPPDVPVTFLSLRTPRDIDGLLPPLTDLDPWSSGWWWKRVGKGESRIRGERKGEGGEEERE